MAKRPGFKTPDPARLPDTGPVDYHPDDTDVPGRAAAEAELSRIEGVRGVGIGRTPTGADAWICYVTDRSAAARLPKSIAGRPIVAEVTGDIDIQTT
jgi:hypothetical protein